jgi:subtilisin family serine protease
MGTIGAVALVAAACQPVAPAPTPPPPSTCDTSSQATPTPQHPVDYAVVVRHAGWSAPQVTSFTATSEADKNAQVAQLQTTGTVLAVGPNNILTAQADPPIATGSYPDYGTQWGLHPSPGADFLAAWNQGYTGTGQTIAIVDTGVDLTHNGLSAHVTAGADFILGGNVTGDPNGHGTHVAGIAADNDTTGPGGLGGAPTAQILAVRVLNPQGVGNDQTVANGVIWAATHGASVINLSLGGAGCDAVLQQATATAESDGATVVAAAGNSASSGLFSPAADTNEVLAVAATDSNGYLASFSNFGGYVAIAAPGVNVLSTCTWVQSGPCVGGATLSDTAYGQLSGTSMATPFVSAAVALIKEECSSRSYTLAQIKALLQHHSNGTVPGEVFNRVDAGAAVAANCPASP